MRARHAFLLLFVLGAIGCREMDAALPADLMTQFRQLGCTDEDLTSHHRLREIRGEFARPRVKDWGVLCRRGRVTTLLVFLIGSKSEPAEFFKTVDGDGQHLIGRSIKPVGKRFIAEHCQSDDGKLPPIDHQGILDGFGGTVVHYYYQGRWLHLNVRLESKERGGRSALLGRLKFTALFVVRRHYAGTDVVNPAMQR